MGVIHFIKGGTQIKKSDKTKKIPEGCFAIKYPGNPIFFIQGTSLIAEEGLNKDHPDTKTAFSYIADSYYFQREYETALVWYNKMLGCSGEIPNAEVLCNIGSIMSSLKGYERAIEWYKEALFYNIKRHGEYHFCTAIIYMSIGVVYFHLNDYNKALRFYEKVLDIHSNLPKKEELAISNTYHSIGLAHDHLGNYKEALQFYNTALRIRGYEIALKIQGKTPRKYREDMEEIYKDMQRAHSYLKKGKIKSKIIQFFRYLGGIILEKPQESGLSFE